MECKVCGSKMVGKCSSYTKSAVHKDAEHCIALADAMGQNNAVLPEDIIQADMEAPSAKDLWCCIYHILTLHKDFQLEQLLIQIVIKNARHIYLFLPCFYYELNPIEMLWGYAKYCACIILMFAAYSTGQLFRILQFSRQKVCYCKGSCPIVP